MHIDDEWIFFGRIEMQRINQPALHVVAVAFPLKVFQLPPCWFHVFVVRGELRPVTNLSGPDFGRGVERTNRESCGFSVGGERDVWIPQPRRDRFAALINVLYLSGTRIDRADCRITADFSRVNTSLS